MKAIGKLRTKVKAAVATASLPMALTAALVTLLTAPQPIHAQAAPAPAPAPAPDPNAPKTDPAVPPPANPTATPAKRDPAELLKVDPAELRSVKNLSLAQDKDDLPKYAGTIVRVRVGGRLDLPRGSLNGNTVQWVVHSVPKGNRGVLTGQLRLHVPPAGLPWLDALKMTPQPGTANEFVYVRVMDYRTALALDTKIVNGPKGPQLAW